MRFTAQHRTRLRQALLDAFTLPALRQLATERLGLPLDHVALPTTGGLSEVVDKLIDHQAAQPGGVVALAQAAAAAVPTDPQLAALAQEWAGADFDVVLPPWRWPFAAAGAVAALLTLALLGWWIWSQRGPSGVAEGNFGVAVAELRTLDEQGAPVRNSIGRTQGKRIARFIAQFAPEIGPMINQTIEVWGDDEDMGPIAPDEEPAERAAGVGAQVLVYGEMRQQPDGRWQLAPQFYLTDKAVRLADELRGEYALGAPLTLAADDSASTGDVNAAMEARVRALLQVVRGLSYYASGRDTDYARAAEVFAQVAADPTWGGAQEESGQEVLYLMLGNALLKQASRTEDLAARRELAQQGIAAYGTALEHNSRYTRALNGLGGALFLAAQQPSSATPGCDDDWDWTMVDQALDAYRRALDASDAYKPASGHVDLRAHVGMGRIYYFQGFCLSTDVRPVQWEEARRHHKAALAEYSAQPDPLAALAPALSYIDLGDMAFNEAEWRTYRDDADADRQRIAALLAEAADHYRGGLELLGQPQTEETTQVAVTLLTQLRNALCFAGQKADAGAALQSYGGKLPAAAQEEVSAATAAACAP